MSWLSDNRGQATVEAAFLLPVLFLVFGMFIQPIALLYNRCVMEAAAAEGCRVYATNTGDEALCRAYVIRRLGAVPNLSIFHDTTQDWEVTFSQDEDGGVGVGITNHATPLPLFGVTSGLVSDIDSSGKIVQSVSVDSSSIPGWVAELDSGPAEWIGAWES